MQGWDRILAHTRVSDHQQKAQYSNSTWFSLLTSSVVGGKTLQVNRYLLFRVIESFLLVSFCLTVGAFCKDNLVLVDSSCLKG